MKKTHCSYMIDQEVVDKLAKHYKDDGSRTRSEFVERAIAFYCGYVTAENYRDYFPQVITSTLDSKLKLLEDRMASLLYKNAVELDILSHIVAATMDVSEFNLPQLRGVCNYEVSNNHGKIKFEDAVRYQKG